MLESPRMNNVSINLRRTYCCCYFLLWDIKKNVRIVPFKGRVKKEKAVAAEHLFGFDAAGRSQLSVAVQGCAETLKYNSTVFDRLQVKWEVTSICPLGVHLGGEVECS